MRCLEGAGADYLEVLDALDNFCSVDDSVVTGNGFVLHLGRLYPRSVDFGSRNGVDPHYPGTKSHLADVSSHSLF